MFGGNRKQEEQKEIGAHSITMRLYFYIREEVVCHWRFIVYLLWEICQMNWWERACIFLPWLQAYHFAGDDKIMCIIDGVAFTYYDRYYWLCGIFWETSLLITVYRTQASKRPKMFLVLGTAMLAFGKTFDEIKGGVEIFQWLPTDVLWMISVYVYLYLTWKKQELKS